MKKLFTLLMIAVASLTVYAQEKLPAFPGAEGYARYITGGRGGKVLHVTSLADDGTTGTLRWAVDQVGARTIVFDISGTIHLTKALAIKNGNVTIAGQSAPGNGICVADYPMSFAGNNIIVRYMRFRVGSKNVLENGADGWDGFGGFDCADIMIDHCSVSWSIDECLSVLGNKNSTVQWCISSHSLVNSGHSKGAHGYGGNWGGDHASFHHNLMAHHVSRTPRLGPRPTTQLSEHMDMRNNVIYNWGGNGCYGGEGMDVNIVNNYYKPGPATAKKSGTIQKRIASVGVRTNEYIKTYPAYAPALHMWGHFYLDGNVNSKYSDVTNNNWTYGFYNQIDASGNDGTYTSATKDSIKLKEPLAFIYTTTHTADVAYERVLDYVGCSLKRDTYDAEVISDVRNGVASHTGSGLDPGHINTPNDLKPAGAGSDWDPLPDLGSVTRGSAFDSDGDGMNDTWEDANGCDPSDPNDANKVAKNGYTNIENYLNSIVKKITDAQNAGGEALGDIVDINSGKDEAKVYEISAQTSEGGGKFGDVSISNMASPATTGSYYLKCSRNTEYSVVLPAGVKIGKVKIDGYCNGDNQTGYVWKVGSLTLGSKGVANNYVLPARNLADHVREYTFDLTTPAVNTMVFACTGDNQCAMRLYLYENVANGISSIYNTDALNSHNVYSVDGRLILKGCNYNRVEDLPKGIYIINGRKVVR